MLESCWALQRLLWDQAEHSQEDSCLWNLCHSLISRETPLETQCKLPWGPCPSPPAPAAFSILQFGEQEAKQSSQSAACERRSSGGWQPSCQSHPCKQGCANPASRQLFVFPTNGNYGPEKNFNGQMTLDFLSFFFFNFFPAAAAGLEIFLLFAFFFPLGTHILS